jgi:hypothetical protein
VLFNEAKKDILVGAYTHSREKIMLRKLRKLVVPFVLVSVSPLLVNSPAYADSYNYYWTDWQKCTFSVIKNQYTPWRAQIQVRRSDKAARPIQVEFGPAYQNDELISSINVSDSWFTGGRRHFSANTYGQAFYPPTFAGISGRFFNLTWISNKLPRYARIVIHHNQNLDVCTSEIRISNLK